MKISKNDLLQNVLLDIFGKCKVSVTSCALQKPWPLADVKKLALLQSA